MLYEKERKLKIVEYIEDNKRASVKELSDFFKVSKSTVRRDLNDLKESNLIKRSHGGAVSISKVNFEVDFKIREDELYKEKKAIAKKAAEFINEKDTILIDSGTTTFYLANEIKKFKKLTIVTNSLVLADKLQLNKSFEIVMVGGNLRSGTKSLVGAITNNNLDKLMVDKAFIAANAVDLNKGITTPNVMEASTKEKMIEISKEVYLLADSSKYGKITFVKFADIKDIDVFITDNSLDKNIKRNIERKELKIHIV